MFSRLLQKCRLAVATLSLLCTLGTSLPSAAAALTVCPGGFCDFTTIQAAVNAAANGDTVRLLFTGTHTEKGIVIARNVTIRGLGSSTIVQASGSPGTAIDRVFYIANGHTVHLRDFLIRHGRKIGDNGGAIYNDGSRLILSSMQLRDNQAGDGGAIYSDGGRLTLNVTYLRQNQAQNGGAIYNTGLMVANQLLLYANQAEFQGGGLYNSATGDASLHDSQVGFNSLEPMAFYDQAGGGIYNRGILTLTATHVQYNTLAGSSDPPFGGGGGIQHSLGTLIIANSMIHHNSIGSSQTGANLDIKGGSAELSHSHIYGGQAGLATAGGLYMATSGSVQIRDSTFDNNQGSNGGGLRWSSGDLHVQNSTISGNTSTSGGALYACGISGSVRLSNVTISGNDAARDGGGIYLCSNTAITLANVTISNNTADYDDNDALSGNGGGIFVSSGGLASLRNSILAGNFDGTDFLGLRSGNCYGQLAGGGYNVIGSLGFRLGNDPPCSVSGNPAGNQIGVDPQLQSLQDNGGATQTHALPAASPAVDAGNPAGCLDGAGLLSRRDQRGALRPNRCDSGAYEYGGLLEHLYLPNIASP